MTFEEMAIERDRELERQRVAAEGGESPPEHRYDFSKPMPAMTMARETAALPWGYDGATDYSTMVERLLSRVWHVLYTLGDQHQETARLRESTRQVLARLGTA